jgi:hypothetical protein
MLCLLKCDRVVTNNVGSQQQRCHVQHLAQQQKMGKKTFPDINKRRLLQDIAVCLLRGHAQLYAPDLRILESAAAVTRKSVVT